MTTDLHCKSKNKMTTLNFDGIPVEFPFEPYSVQREYMKNVIECLQRGVHGILESPTGTGKTLCLLCSTLGWQQNEKERMIQEAFIRDDVKEDSSETDSSQAMTVPKIIYASRTHSQLKQAISEVRRTKYADKIKCVVIGSRELLCIHPQVIKEFDGEEKANICSRLKAGVQKDSNTTEIEVDPEERKCPYYKNVDIHKNAPEFTKSGIIDIEDIVKSGKKLKCCPYYTAKALQKDADVIFMPYNYILIPSIRSAMNTMLTNNIVILDEAHNINKICEEAASFKLCTSDITKCIEEVALATTQRNQDTRNPEFNNVFRYTDEALIELRNQLLALERNINEINISNDLGNAHPGQFLLELLIKAGITKENSNQVGEMCKNLGTFLIMSPQVKKKQGTQLKNLSYKLYTIFNNEDGSEDDSCYKVFVEWKNKQNRYTRVQEQIPPREKVINYWCFSPAVNMKRLEKLNIHSILLTSGTLGSIPALISELGIKFPVTLANLHVVKPDQVFIAVVSNGSDGKILNSSYHKRGDPLYKRSLGWTVAKFSTIIPNGLLVFFPSYALLEDCKEQWKADGGEIWGRIAENKALFMESKNKKEFRDNMDGFYDQLEDDDDDNDDDGDNRGACFLAVCRGKVSEGLDFSDENGRGVMITGLPYLPMKDPRVELKREYLDAEHAKKKERLSGWDWYNLEASNAVNQAIGRVIRHKDDYGVILLCDTRFKNSSFINNLSAWLRPYVRIADDFKTVEQGVTKFLKNAQSKFSMDNTASGLWAEATPNKNTQDSSTVTPLSQKSMCSSSCNTTCVETPSKRSRTGSSVDGNVMTPVNQDKSENETGDKVNVVRRKLDLSRQPKNRKNEKK